MAYRGRRNTFTRINLSGLKNLVWMKDEEGSWVLVDIDLELFGDMAYKDNKQAAVDRRTMEIDNTLTFTNFTDRASAIHSQS